VSHREGREERDTHEDVVGLDISVHDSALLHQRESEEHLVSVSSNGFDVESDVLSESLDHVSEVHAVGEKGKKKISARVFLV